MGSFSVSWQRTSREFLALAAICLHFSLVANAFPLPRAPWAASEYPDPRIEPSQCRVPQRAGLIICDPEELFAASVRADEYTRADRVFRVFSDEFGTHFGEHWGSSVGIALLQETSAALEPFADQLSQQWGLNKPGDVLLVLRLGSSPRATLAGGFLYEEATSESTWRAAAEDRASLLLRAGRLADAIEAGLSGASEALGGDALEAVQRPRAPMRLFKGHSDYQLVEVEETICGGRRCRQFILDHQVQLSDRFERYFHEAMTMVALNALGANGKRVLVIGGGDGGISTLAVRYSFVQKVVVVDIDEMVTNTSQRWFPTVSSGLSDKRTQLVRTDAIEWVKTCQDVFDLIVVDFTQENEQVPDDDDHLGIIRLWNLWMRLRGSGGFYKPVRSSSCTPRQPGGFGSSKQVIPDVCPKTHGLSKPRLSGGPVCQNDARDTESQSLEGCDGDLVSGWETVHTAGTAYFANILGKSCRDVGNGPQTRSRMDLVHDCVV